MKLHSESVRISVTSTAWGGYGLIAKQEVKEGDEVLVLQEVNELIETVLRHPKFGAIFTSFYKDGMSENLLVILVLLYE